MIFLQAVSIYSCLKLKAGQRLAIEKIVKEEEFIKIAYIKSGLRTVFIEVA
jgi:hypothetical protein